MRFVAEHGSILLFVVWMMSGSILKQLNKVGKREMAPRLAVWLYHELRPFAPYFILVHMLTHGSRHIIASVFELAVYTYFWYISKDADDDDRWKKRAKSVGDAVKSLGHKLVVVNEGA